MSEARDESEYDFSGGERGPYAGPADEVPAEPSGGGAAAGARVVRRDYWSGGHRSYRGRVHDPVTDESLHHDDVLRGLLEEAGAYDGDEVEVVVRRTGERPFGRRIFAWTEPHEYAPVEPESPEGRAALAPRDRHPPGGCPCCAEARRRARGREGEHYDRGVEEENDH